MTPVLFLILFCVSKLFQGVLFVSRGLFRPENQIVIAEHSAEEPPG